MWCPPSCSNEVTEPTWGPRPGPSGLTSRCPGSLGSGRLCCACQRQVSRDTARRKEKAETVTRKPGPCSPIPRPVQADRAKQQPQMPAVGDGPCRHHVWPSLCRADTRPGSLLPVMAATPSRPQIPRAPSRPQGGRPDNSDDHVPGSQGQGGTGHLPLRYFYFDDTPRGHHLTDEGTEAGRVPDPVRVFQLRGDAMCP